MLHTASTSRRLFDGILILLTELTPEAEHNKKAKRKRGRLA